MESMHRPAANLRPPSPAEQYLKLQHKSLKFIQLCSEHSRYWQTSKKLSNIPQSSQIFERVEIIFSKTIHVHFMAIFVNFRTYFKKKFRKMTQ